MQARAHPSQLTWSNYSQLFDNDQILSSFRNTFRITVPATSWWCSSDPQRLMPSPGVEFPGPDWIFLDRASAAGRADQGRLIPVVKLYNTLGIRGSPCGTTCLSPLEVFLAFQRFFVQGTMAGSVK